MLMPGASRLAIEALVELADLGPQEWITAEALGRALLEIFLSYSRF